MKVRALKTLEAYYNIVTGDPLLWPLARSNFAISLDFGADGVSISLTVEFVSRVQEG